MTAPAEVVQRTDIIRTFLHNSDACPAAAMTCFAGFHRQDAVHFTQNELLHRLEVWKVTVSAFYGLLEQSQVMLLEVFVLWT